MCVASNYALQSISWVIQLGAERRRTSLWVTSVAICLIALLTSETR